MSGKVKPNSLAPIDQGIDRVLRKSATRGSAPLLDLVRQSVTVGSAPLPDFADVAPPETPAHSKLDQLLALPNIDEFIDGELRPGIDSLEILSPSRFRSELGSTLAGLRAAAETSPRAARTLGRAARLLADEANLRDLLQMYRSALVQG
jgi:type III secretion protein X